MDIRVSGHQVDTGAALKLHVETRLTAFTEKYFARALSANATFGKGPHDHGFVCDIMLHVMHGVVLKGAGQGQEAHPAFEMAAEKVEKQLRRYKRRLRDRQADTTVPNGEALDNAAYTVFLEHDEEDEVADNPPIIAETRVDVPETSVSDAVMMLDLRNTNALLFRNLGTGAHNMVYRRGDGTIGWVEPH